MRCCQLSRDHVRRCDIAFSLNLINENRFVVLVSRKIYILKFVIALLTISTKCSIGIIENGLLSVSRLVSDLHMHACTAIYSVFLYLGMVPINFGAHD